MEVGVIYSATKNGKDTLVKGGGDDVQTVVSRNVANWTGSPNSGDLYHDQEGQRYGQPLYAYVCELPYFPYEHPGAALWFMVIFISA